MRIPLKNIKKCTVETAGGLKIGKVQDIIVDTNGQLIAQYVVVSSLMHRKTYLVSRDQVVRFEAEKIIVDNTVHAEAGKKKEDQKNLPNPEPVVMREA